MSSAVAPKTPTIEPAEPEAIEIAPELAPTAWPAPAPVETVDAGEPAKRFRTPFGGRIDTSVREASLVLGTIAVAIGVGIGVASIIGNSGDSPQGSSVAVRPASVKAPAAADAPSGPATLHGVTPNFKASNDSGPAAASKAATDTPAAPVAQTNSKPSSIPAGVADTKAAIETARGFSGAFVLYEIGKTNAQVRKTFEATATPALAKALAERPPRLPDNANVPTAKVQNIVLGTEKGNEVEASVSLLRLGTLASFVSLSPARTRRTTGRSARCADEAAPDRPRDDGDHGDDGADRCGRRAWRHNFRERASGNHHHNHFDDFDDDVDDHHAVDDHDRADHRRDRGAHHDHDHRSEASQAAACGRWQGRQGRGLGSRDEQ